MATYDFGPVDALDAEAIGPPAGKTAPREIPAQADAAALFE
jgi:hypothetical protein